MSIVLIKFFKFFQKNRPCPEVGKLEGTPSVFAYLIGNNFTFFKTLIHEIREHFINLIFSLEVHEKELDKKAEVVRKSYLTLSEYIDGD